MRILHLSDTHGQHNRVTYLPAADVIVHSGDITQNGTEEESADFLLWFSELPYTYKLFIAGNHDDVVCKARLPKHVFYLCCSSVVIDGVKFYGVPMCKKSCLNGDDATVWNSIPLDTDVLITHEPPKMYCDAADYGYGLVHRGNAMLAERVNQIHPYLHLFGHEHDAYGVELHNGTLFSNASVLNSACQMVNSPRLVDLKLGRERVVYLEREE